jgi:hypothetical protein
MGKLEGVFHSCVILRRLATSVSGLADVFAPAAESCLRTLHGNRRRWGGTQMMHYREPTEYNDAEEELQECPGPFLN